MIQKPYRGQLLNKTHPLARGLAGGSLFNAYTGPAVDIVSCQCATQAIASWVGGGVEINAGTHYVSFPVPPGMSVSKGSVFIIAAPLAGGGYNNISFLFGHYNAGNRIYLQYNTTTLEFMIRLGSSAVVNTGKFFDSGEVNTACLTWDNGDYVAYLNGVSVSSGNYVGLAAFDDDFCFGNFRVTDMKYHIVGRFITGYLYDYALTAAAVAQLHREPYAMFGGGGDISWLASAALLANVLNSNPLLIYDPIASLQERLSYIHCIQWVDYAANIANDSDLVMKINGVEIAIKPQRSETKANVDGGGVVYQTNFKKPLRAQDFEVTTLDKGVVIVWLV